MTIAVTIVRQTITETVSYGTLYSQTLNSLSSNNTVNPSLTATSQQRQRPLKRVPNCQNNLSKTASYFQGLIKNSRMVMQFDLLMIKRGNIILIVFHLSCYSNHKFYTILIANAANFARLVT